MVLFQHLKTAISPDELRLSSGKSLLQSDVGVVFE